MDDEGVVAEGGAFNKRGRIWYKILDSWQMRKGLLQKLGLSIDEEGIVAIAGGSGKQGRSHCEDWSLRRRGLSTDGAKGLFQKLGIFEKNLIM